MRKDVALAKGIAKISDLRAHPELRFGFVQEFLDRQDGWPGVRRYYDFATDECPRHEPHPRLSRARRAGHRSDRDDTTDGEIAQNDLLLLKDDQSFFPAYEAVWLYRAELAERYPAAVERLRRLEGPHFRNSDRRMNAAAQEGKRREGMVAAEFLRSELGVDTPTSDGTLVQRVLATTGEHLLLVIPSLLAAVLVGIPLGVFAARQPPFSRVIFAATGILQTIPSLALLLFMIPIMMWLVGKGTGAPPAIIALFLYSLLPIVRNTHAGLTGIPASLRESAEALGLPPLAVLWRIELPLATPTILAGLRTAAVINVGTATLGGFIGAGGYGGPILRGIDKFDVPLMLEGAVPAALLALVIEGLFELVERTSRTMGPQHG